MLYRKGEEGDQNCGLAILNRFGVSVLPLICCTPVPLKIWFAWEKEKQADRDRDAEAERHTEADNGTERDKYRKTDRQAEAERMHA